MLSDIKMGLAGDCATPFIEVLPCQSDVSVVAFSNRAVMEDYQKKIVPLQVCLVGVSHFIQWYCSSLYLTPKYVFAGFYVFVVGHVSRS